MLLLPVRVNGNLCQSEVLKVEWFSRCRTVEGIVTHRADDDARGNLSGEQFQPTAGFMTHVTCRLTAK